jgi:acyl carrier protein
MPPVPNTHVTLRASTVNKIIVAELAETLGIDAALIDAAKRFDEYGLDSTDAIVVVGLVEERLDIELPAELLLRNMSIDEVMDDLIRQRIVVED